MSQKDVSARVMHAAARPNSQCFVVRADPACNAVDQAVLSCYPQSNTSVPQDEYSKFIWNPNIPQNIGRGSVDIYVFNAGSEESVQSWRNIPNDRGSIGFQVNEGWFPSRSAWSDGQTATNSYYFVVATAGTREERLGSLPHQATFVALQTNPPASLVASLSSAATAQAVPTAAAGQTTASNAPTPTSPDDVAASLSAAGLVPISTDAAGQTYYTTGSGYRGAPALTSGGRLASTPTVTPTLPPGILTQPQSTNTSRNPSSLQNGNGDGNSIPAWAIALIAVFGAIALLAGLIGLWFCLRRTRRKRRRESRFLASGPASGRDSVANADGTAREVQSPSQQALMSERQHADRPLSGQTDNTSFAPYSAIGSAGTRSSMQGTSALFGDSPAAASSNIGGSATLAGAAGVANFAAGRRSETPRSASSGYAGDSPTPHRTMSPQGRQAGGVHQKPSQHSLASSSAIAPTDAAIIGDAFRKILRKPEFTQNDSGSSGEHDNSGTNTPRQHRASMTDAAGEVSSRHERRRTRASSFG